MPPENKIPNNSEIDKALKEFEAQAQAEQAKQAPKVPTFNSDVPKMTQRVMRIFGVEQKPAEYILLGFVVIAFALSFYFFFRGEGAGHQRLTPEQIKQTPVVSS